MTMINIDTSVNMKQHSSHEGFQKKWYLFYEFGQLKGNSRERG